MLQEYGGMRMKRKIRLCVILLAIMTLFSGRPVSAYTSGFGMGAYKTYTFGSYQIKNSQQGLYSRKGASGSWKKIANNVNSFTVNGSNLYFVKYNYNYHSDSGNAYVYSTDLKGSRVKRICTLKNRAIDGIYYYSSKLYINERRGKFGWYISEYSLKSKKYRRIREGTLFCAYKNYALFVGRSHNTFTVPLYSRNLITGKMKKLGSHCYMSTGKGRYVYFDNYSKHTYARWDSGTFVVKRALMNGSGVKTLTPKLYGKVRDITSKYVEYENNGITKRFYYNSSTFTNSNKNNTAKKPTISVSCGATGNNTVRMTVKCSSSGKITWNTSNSGVVVVNSSGIITAKGKGTAKITAKISTGGKEYSVSKTIVIDSKKEYGSWSGWSLVPANADNNHEIQTTTLYRYYYFYCPVCGGREPLQGISDCHQYNLSLSDGVVGWFTTPYSDVSSAQYSYAAYKRYTFALGDGQRWNFSAGNINDHAIDTKDTDSAATVICKGYRKRSVNTSYYISSVA